LKQRQAVLGILLLALLAAAALFFADRRPSTEALAEQAAAAAAIAAGELQPEAGTAAAGDPGALTREKVAAPASADGAGPDESHVAEPVHLRVQLQIVNEQGDWGAPPGCQGWRVQAQTWVAEPRGIVTHEAFANAKGIAEFVFPDEVHVDWVACQPPNPRWGFTYSEQHQDIGGGTFAEWTLPLADAGCAFGLVLNAQEQPVAGAVVHAFNPQWTYGFDDWTPGFLIATTGVDGRYRFPALAAGPWVFAVEPRQWLQYQPPLGSGSEGADRAEISAGNASEVGTLRVVAADGIAIEVVDATGQPVQQAHVWAQPLTFADAALGTPVLEVSADSSGDPILERFLAGENWEAWTAAQDEPDAGPVADYWANESMSRPTDAKGVARFSLPAGVWRFGCYHEQLSDEELERTTIETRVPGPSVRITLPFRLRSFSARLVHEDGQPASGANLSLIMIDGSSSLYAETGDDGRFTFSAAPATGTWRLDAWAANSVASTWTLDLSQDPGGDFYLPRRAPILLQLRTPAGAPLVQENGSLIVRPLQWDMPPAPPGARTGHPYWSITDGQIHLQAQPEVSDLWVLPGQYEVVLGADAWNGRWSAWGPEYERIELGRWIVSPRPEPWVLVAEPVATQPDEALMAGLIVNTRDAVTRELLGNVEILVRRGSNLHSRWHSDDDGSFELRVAPGRYALSGQHEGYMVGEVSGDYASGSHEIELLLHPGGSSFTAMIRDRDGHRIPPCEIRLFSSTSSTSPFAEYWCQDGMVYLEYLSADEVIVEAEFWGTIRARGRLDLRADDTHVREVRLDLTLDELREQLRANPPD
jgi:hypothetical protein